MKHIEDIPFVIGHNGWTTKGIQRICIGKTGRIGLIKKICGQIDINRGDRMFASIMQEGNKIYLCLVNRNNGEGHLVLKDTQLYIKSRQITETIKKHRDIPFNTEYDLFNFGSKTKKMIGLRILLCEQNTMYINGALENMKIEELELSARCYTALKDRAKIKTVGELVSYSETGLLRFRTFGAKSVAEIVSELSKYGLKLKEDK